MNKITIAIPVYNVRDYIRIALLSALNQTYTNLEILLIDDKGSDDSIKIAKEICSSHYNGTLVKIIEHDFNKGLGATRNSAIKYCTGDFLFFMDSDDVISPDCIELLNNKMLEHPVDFIGASYNRMDENGRVTEDCVICNDVLIEGEFSLAKYHYIEGKEILVHTWNKLYNIKFLRENGIVCIPHHICEDMVFNYQLLLNANSCRLISNITYSYRNSPASIMSTVVDGSIPDRIAKDLMEYIEYKKLFARKLQITSIYSTLIKEILLDSTRKAIDLSVSKLISRENKRLYIESILNFDYNFDDMKEMSFKYRYCYCLGKLPYILKLINLRTSRVCIDIRNFIKSNG